MTQWSLALIHNVLRTQLTSFPVASLRGNALFPVVRASDVFVCLCVSYCSGSGSGSSSMCVSVCVSGSVWVRAGVRVRVCVHKSFEN